MKAFILKSLCFIPLLTVVIGINLVTKPYHLNNSEKYSYSIAHLLLDGNNVTNIFQPDDAAIVTDYIQGLNQRKDILVFGSSRSRLIRSSFFSDPSFFNNGIAGAGILDYIALYDQYAAKRLIPSTMILEVSPWVFTANYRSIFDSLNNRGEEILTGKQPQSPLASFTSQYKDMLSLGYFQISFYKLLQNWLFPAASSNNDSVVPFYGNGVAKNETLLTDGSVVYFRDHFHVDADRKNVEAAAVEYGQNPASIPDQMSPENQSYFENFVDLLLKDHVRVLFYLPPYHPQAYALLMASTKYRELGPIEDYVRSYAQKKGIQVIGSYDPGKLSITEDGFFDGSHMNEETIQKLFLESLPPDLRNSTADINPKIWFTNLDNPNGIETLNNRVFFWVGKGSTCLEVNSASAGFGKINFSGMPGPSITTTGERHLQLTVMPGQYSKQLIYNQYPQNELDFPVTTGINLVCLKPLDQYEGLINNRSLILGVSDPRISFSTGN